MENEEGSALRAPKKAGGAARGLRWAARRVPLVRWARGYSRAAAAGDLVAGVTLGLTLVPQSIAYAALADLPVHYGLYSSFMGTMLYVVFGTVKEVSIGPTSLTSLLTLQVCKGLPIEYVVLLTFLSGCIVFLMGLLQLGSMVELISPAVTSGFTSGTAVIIVAAQVKGLVGLSFLAETVTENAEELWRRWRGVRLADCALSVVCCAALLALRKLKDVRVREGRERLGKLLWFVSISRNALVVCAASLFAYCTHDPDHLLVKLSGRVEGGLPPLSWPAFSVTRDNNTVGFVGMVHELGAGLAMMPIVMVLANIAIAKAFTEGGHMDATQEMLTLGVCNMAGALVHAMPTCGAFTRSAVSHASGVRTPAAGLYSGIITLMALMFMTEYFYYIPKACLSSVLVCAVIFMIDITTVKQLWMHSRSELGVLVVTFLVTVGRSVELGVLAGALAALALLLAALARPAVAVSTLTVRGAQCVRVRPSLALLYLNAGSLVARLRALPARDVLLLDCGSLSLLDYTATQELERLMKDLEKSEQQLVVYNASAEVLVRLVTLPALRSRAAMLRARTASDALAALCAEDKAAQVALQADRDAQITSQADRDAPTAPRADAPLLPPAPAPRDACNDSNV